MKGKKYRKWKLKPHVQRMSKEDREFYQDIQTRIFQDSHLGNINLPSKQMKEVCYRIIFKALKQHAVKVVHVGDPL